VSPAARVSVEILGQRFEPIAAGLFMIARGLPFRDVDKAADRLFKQRVDAVRAQRVELPAVGLAGLRDILF
jgi:hypothetical protein